MTSDFTPPQAPNLLKDSHGDVIHKMDYPVGSKEHGELVQIDRANSEIPVDITTVTATLETQITDGVDTALVDGSGNLMVKASSGATRTYATYSATISADTDIVSAVASKRIKVYAYSITTVSTSENTIIFKSNGTGGTELWRVDLQAPSSIVAGANMAVSPGLDGAFLFATAAGEKLTVDVSAAVAIHISVAYWADDAS